MDRKNFITVEELHDALATVPGMPEAIEAERANLRAARFVQETRKAAKLSQAALAERIGVTQARISQMEKGDGRYGPSLTLLTRIARACGGELRLSFDKSP